MSTSDEGTTSLFTRARRAALGALPPGTFPLACATAVAGITVYGFLGLTARVLGPVEYAPLSVLWSLVLIMGPGLFVPLEQELGRSLAGVGAGGPLAGSLVRRSVIVGTVVSAFVVTVALVGSQPLLEHLFGGSWALLAACCIAVPALAATHLLRGLLAGQGRFMPYAWLLGAEGVVRFVGAALLFLAGATLVGEYGILVGLAPLVAVVAVALASRPRIPPVREVVPWRRVIESVAYLLVGSLGLQVLINAGPLAVQLIGGGEQPDAAGRLLAGLVLTRVPLYMFQAVQAALVPELAAMGAASDHTSFRRGITRLLLAIGALTALGVLGAVTVGPAALSLLFGPEFTLTRLDLALLTLASCTLMGAQACGGALVSVHRHARAGLGWAAGVVVFGLALLWPGPLFLRVELALLAGSLASAVALGAALASTVRRQRRTEPAQTVAHGA